MFMYVRPWVAVLGAWLRVRSDLTLENAALRSRSPCTSDSART